MSTFESFLESSKVEITSIISQGSNTIQTWQEKYKQLFPCSTMSQTVEMIEKKNSDNDTTNDNTIVATALAETINIIDIVTTNMTLLEQFIMLSIPQMEDGNNFGVTVQLALLKQITDYRDKNNTHLDELMKYNTTRADLIEKLKLPTVVITETKIQSESKGIENNEDKNSSSSNQETKTISTRNDIHAMLLQQRQQSIVTNDVLFYNKAKHIYSQTVSMYLAILDFYHKNQTKLLQPKGSRGSSTYSSMY